MECSSRIRWSQTFFSLHYLPCKAKEGETGNEAVKTLVPNLQRRVNPSVGLALPKVGRYAKNGETPYIYLMVEQWSKIELMALRRNALIADAG